MPKLHAAPEAEQDDKYFFIVGWMIAVVKFVFSWRSRTFSVDHHQAKRSSALYRYYFKAFPLSCFFILSFSAPTVCFSSWERCVLTDQDVSSQQTLTRHDHNFSFISGIFELKC